VVVVHGMARPGDDACLRRHGSTPSTEARLDEWCDTATFGDWEQDSAELPDWQTAYRHLVDQGRSADLTNASGANETRSFPPPVEAG
jgi:hypothetical protein